MSRPKTRHVESTLVRTLDELTKAVRTIFRKSRTGWWFRGHPDASWHLLPKVWRGYDAQTERYLTNLFYQRAKLRHAQFPESNDYAGWLALMQHYGLPTRLLDWSDSVLIAAYFATRYNRDILGNTPDRDAAIWMLDPCRLNHAQGYERVFPPLNANSVAPLVLAAFKDESAAKPRRSRVSTAKSCRGMRYDVLAAVPVNHDLRMLMQQGAFTIHATPDPLNTRPDCGSWLKKLVIPRNCVASISVSLDILGVRLSDVFPDLGHLAIDLTNMHRPIPT